MYIRIRTGEFVNELLKANKANGSLSADRQGESHLPTI